MTFFAITPRYTEAPTNSFTEVGIKLIEVTGEVIEKIDAIVFFFQLNIWPYIRETINLTRQSLSIVMIVKSLEKELEPIISKIRIVSVVSLFFAVRGVISEVSILVRNARLQDIEGVALSVFSLLTKLGNVVDEISTVLTSLEKGFEYLELSNANAFLKPFGLPIVFAMIIHSILRGTYNSIRLGMELYQLPSEIKTLDDLEEFKNLMVDKLDVTQLEMNEFKTKHLTQGWILNTYNQEAIDADIALLKEKKLNILIRHTDFKIVNIMKNLQSHLNEKKYDIETANLALRDIKTISYRKIGATTVTTLVNSVQLAAIVASNFFAAPPLVLPIVGLVKAGVGLANHTFQTYFLYSNLEIPEFVEAPV